MDLEEVEKKIVKHDLNINIVSNLEETSWRTVATFSFTVFDGEKSGNSTHTVASLDDDYSHGMNTIFASLAHILSDSKFREDLLGQLE